MRNYIIRNLVKNYKENKIILEKTRKQKMNEIEVYKLLEEKKIKYEKMTHRAVFSMKEITDIQMLYPEDEAKNLFIRDDKKEKYYLISVRGDKKIDLKAFRKEHNLRHLSFASSEDLMKMMKLKPGAVTPFGLLNDVEKRVEFYLDEDFLKGNGRIGCHPNENTASIWLKTKDLLKIVEEHGNNYKIVKIG